MGQRPRTLALVFAVLLIALLPIGLYTILTRAQTPMAISLSLRARDAWSAELRIALPRGAAGVRIWRGDRVIDQFSAPATRVAYTDYQLWPSTSYAYAVEALDQRGSAVARARTSVTTRPMEGPVPRLYAASSFWNTAIGGNSSIDPESGPMVQGALVRDAADANLANSDEWGIAIAFANPVDATVQVGCTRIDCDQPVTYPIPSSAQPTTGADHHLTVLDLSQRSELDTWLAARDERTATWSAGSRYVTSTDGWGALCAIHQHCGAAVASGFAALGGIIRPEEIAQGHIDHALFITLPHIRRDTIACPATGTDGTDDDPSAIPEGSRIQLDPAVDVEAMAWPRWEKIVAHALQRYGAYVGDKGGSLAIRAEAAINRGYPAWAIAGVPTTPSLSNLPWDRIRVLQIEPC